MSNNIVRLIIIHTSEDVTEFSGIYRNIDHWI